MNFFKERNFEKPHFSTGTPRPTPYNKALQTDIRSQNELKQTESVAKPCRFAGLVGMTSWWKKRVWITLDRSVAGGNPSTGLRF